MGKKTIRIQVVGGSKQHYATKEANGWRLLCAPDKLAPMDKFWSACGPQYLCPKCAKQRPCKKHKWQLLSHCRKGVQERCKICGLGRERKWKDLSDIERRWLQDHWRTLMRETPAEDVHRVWHEFHRRFFDEIKEGEFEMDGKKFPLTRHEWKWTGYALMQRISKWADKHPNDVFIHGVDDNSFMSSDMVYILHRSQTEWMGVSVVFVPQNGETPHSAFLYPGHMLSAYNRLGYLLKVCSAYKDGKWELSLLKRR